MPQLVEPEELQHAQDDHMYAIQRRDKQRAVLRLCLDEIASEVTTALQDAALTLPVFLSVPSSGALLTFCTPTDPSDQDWSTVIGVIVDIAGKKIEVSGLISRPLVCAAVGRSANAAGVSSGTDLLIV